jgi:uncharacterized damage-inducible protein DinB
MSIESVFLNFSADKLAQFSERVETCLDKLTPDQIWLRRGENENAAGNLALHLAGNVRQWILAGIGGEPDHRIREREFSARGGSSPEELKKNLRTTVHAAIAVIRSLPPERLVERVTIQNYSGTVLEAIYHVVEHFSGHTGQIIFVTKLLTGDGLGFYAHLDKPQPHNEKTP